MDFKTWSTENLVAERRRNEVKIKELRARSEQDDRFAIMYFNERDRANGGLLGDRSRARDFEERAKNSQNSARKNSSEASELARVNDVIETELRERSEQKRKEAQNKERAAKQRREEAQAERWKVETQRHENLKAEHIRNDNGEADRALSTLNSEIELYQRSWLSRKLAALVNSVFTAFCGLILFGFIFAIVGELVPTFVLQVLAFLLYPALVIVATVGRFLQLKELRVDIEADIKKHRSMYWWHDGIIWDHRKIKGFDPFADIISIVKRTNS